MKAIIGKKIAMTQIFDKDGKAVPVTVIEAGPCFVVQKKTSEVDGYEAVQIGFDPAKEKRVTNPLKGHFSKAGVKPTRVLKEFREATDMEVGASFGPEIFEVGTTISITGKSKGRGFQGVVKRHGYSGGPQTHGSKTGRIPGSIGNSAYPGRVIPGKKLPGHMGDAQITVQNSTVMGVDAEQNLIWIKGGVPGARGSYLTIKATGK
ncbi:MAG: 50S ribosomal protein L3 [Candidatus Eisenbacteria bacterium]|uniref:Large ribosomal subunit protein uL3 n=1 Tax=Eiseniibacteriota bacterium TaxID=2212470 RepID=A0A7Y2E4T1_UNCEI|nr:50S ribosomal protein L3 [Candidatus Eisenbacteria bacterium]